MSEPASPYTRLFNNMRLPRSFPHTDDETRRLTEEQFVLREALADDFARQHKLTRYRGWPDWWRIIGKTLATRPPDYNLPEDDHGELFARDGKPVAWVVHVYGPLNDTQLRRMMMVGEKYGLKFSVDSRDWYFPGTALTVVWTRRDDPLLS